MSRHNDDDDKILKDGESVRISMTMRDSLDNNRITDAKPQFTDGRTTDPTALNRPGYRIPAVNDRRAVHDAYAKYQDELVNAYRAPVPVSEAQDHRATVDSKTIDQLYAERDAELADAWRTK
jgi:hypothetical protein